MFRNGGGSQPLGRVPTYLLLRVFELPFGLVKLLLHLRSVLRCCFALLGFLQTCLEGSDQTLLLCLLAEGCGGGWVGG